MCWRANRPGRVRGGYGAQHLPVQRPRAMLKAVKKVVHENLNAREAYRILGWKKKES